MKGELEGGSDFFFNVNGKSLQNSLQRVRTNTHSLLIVHLLKMTEHKVNVDVYV